jgi:hypothetical protein
MPEPIGVVWLILIGSGGYVLAIVQFFKDFLSVRKLELEVQQLRHAANERNAVITRATPEDIERYGRPMASAPSRRGFKGTSVIVAAVAFIATLLFVVVEHGERPTQMATPKTAANVPAVGDVIIGERVADSHGHVAIVESADSHSVIHKTEAEWAARERSQEDLRAELEIATEVTRQLRIQLRESERRVKRLSMAITEKSLPPTTAKGGTK